VVTWVGGLLRLTTLPLARAEEGASVATRVKMTSAALKIRKKRENFCIKDSL
jgi:hypothetical protein